MQEVPFVEGQPADQILVEDRAEFTRIGLQRRRYRLDHHAFAFHGDGGVQVEAQALIDFHADRLRLERRE